MPAGNRVRGNNVFGFTTDNPLTAGAGTFNSPGLATLPVVASAHAVITLDPMREFGEPEIVIVTIHTAAATVATITRGAYGTVARSHPLNTLFVHAPIDEDVAEIGTTAQRPTDPYFGQPYFNSTLNSLEVRDTVPSWQNVNMLADPPACRVFHNVGQSIPDNTVTTIAFNSERFDTDSMHDIVTNNSRITFNKAGLYVVNGLTNWDAGADYTQVQILLRLNGTTYIAGSSTEQFGDGTASPRPGLTTVYKFAAGDYVELHAYQDNTANAARTLQVNANFSPEFSAVWVGRG